MIRAKHSVSRKGAKSATLRHEAAPAPAVPSLLQTCLAKLKSQPVPCNTAPFAHRVCTLLPRADYSTTRVLSTGIRDSRVAGEKNIQTPREAQCARACCCKVCPSCKGANKGTRRACFKPCYCVFGAVSRTHSGCSGEPCIRGVRYLQSSCPVRVLWRRRIGVASFDVRRAREARSCVFVVSNQAYDVEPLCVIAGGWRLVAW